MTCVVSDHRLAWADETYERLMRKDLLGKRRAADVGLGGNFFDSGDIRPPRH